MSKKAIISIAAMVTGIMVVCIVSLILINKYSIPNKEERLKEMMAHSGKTELDRNDFAKEIALALSRNINWDNLFLSENFKNTYKNRNNIIDDANSIININYALDYESDNSVIIYADREDRLLNQDDSEDITTVYKFCYDLNDSGEIDNIVLLDKYDMYTMTGVPVQK